MLHDTSVNYFTMAKHAAGFLLDFCILLCCRTVQTVCAYSVLQGCLCHHDDLSSPHLGQTRYCHPGGPQGSCLDSSWSLKLHLQPSLIACPCQGREDPASLPLLHSSLPQATFTSSCGKHVEFPNQ